REEGGIQTLGRGERHPGHEGARDERQPGGHGPEERGTGESRAQLRLGGWCQHADPDEGGRPEPHRETEHDLSPVKTTIDGGDLRKGARRARRAATPGPDCYCRAELARKYAPDARNGRGIRGGSPCQACATRTGYPLIVTGRRRARKLKTAQYARKA